jgi:hypothetical protein
MRERHTSQIIGDSHASRSPLDASRSPLERISAISSLKTYNEYFQQVLPNLKQEEEPKKKREKKIKKKMTVKKHHLES